MRNKRYIDIDIIFFSEQKKEKGSQLRYNMHTEFDSKVASFNPIGCPASYLIKEINFAFSERYRRERERLENLEKKPSLSGIIESAKHKSETSKVLAEPHFVQMANTDKERQEAKV